MTQIGSLRPVLPSPSCKKKGMWQRQGRSGCEITYLLVTEVSQWCASDQRQSTVFWNIILTRFSKQTMIQDEWMSPWTLQECV